MKVPVHKASFILCMKSQDIDGRTFSQIVGSFRICQNCGSLDSLSNIVGLFYFLKIIGDC